MHSALRPSSCAGSYGRNKTASPSGQYGEGGGRLGCNTAELLTSRLQRRVDRPATATVTSLPHTERERLAVPAAAQYTPTRQRAAGGPHASSFTSSSKLSTPPALSGTRPLLGHEALNDSSERSVLVGRYRGASKPGRPPRGQSTSFLPAAVNSNAMSRSFDQGPTASSVAASTQEAVAFGRPSLRSKQLSDEAAAALSPPLLSSSTLIPPPLPHDVGKLVVVLDLDETLVHSRDTTVYERPGVMQLLKTLKGKCEVIVWTAGTREYALDVIRIIDSVCAVQHCIYRHPMWWTGDVGCTKDLRMLGRPMDRVLLVDNTPTVFRANPRHSILIEDFTVPTARAYNAQEKTLFILADIFEQAFRRASSPTAADVLMSKCLSRQVVRLESGGSLELNVLLPCRHAGFSWSAPTRSTLVRLTV